MENGKPTGPKPKWWSRPAHPEPSSPVDAASAAEHTAGVVEAGAPGSDDRVSVAPGALVDDQPEYPLPAPLTPAEQQSPAPGRPGSAPAEPGAPEAPAAAQPSGGTREESGPVRQPESEDNRASGPVVAYDGDISADVPAVDEGAGHAWASGPVVAHDADNRRDGGPRAPYSPPVRDAAPGPAAGAPHPAGVPAAGPSDGGARPLHEPDEYRTPPYGGPGPWAPAPPVQHPGGAGGTPPPYPAGGGQPGSAAPAPHAAPVPGQWRQYDPWGAPGGTLIRTGEPPRQKSRRGMAFAGALVFALLAGVLGGGVGAYLERNGGITTVELPQSGPERTDRAPDSVAGIAASALPGVVTLHVSGGGEQGTGTGFVLDAQGHILTNNHVVSPAGSSGDISVTFSGGETARATLVGKDSGYDLAVVKVRGVSGLKPLPLGNSDNVRVGDPVVAIGAPFDLQNTVTAGIISAKERPITAGGEKGDGSDISYVDALQTDAPINPGNSGGPLVDSRARVIGINSAIRAADGGSGPDAGSGQAGSIGLGFAIPINQGKRVAEELINTGKATHPVIGVSLDMEYSGDGARVGEKGKDGAPSVVAGGPAAKAGIRPGDVITKVDGQRVHNGEELIVKIRAHRPGDRLELTVLRDGKERTRAVTLGSSTGT
ncbi:S1C family serine protease [Streptomyces sp. WMMC940]|uniref:S1C family serine protease n=1 Tax=Streptomyces sp. WMMC940 TaxID=3015153 RepID=UPI0022B6705F|nr:trypsin-like peptidase domain-containing protein [Streptomyces sp. WMMC940]MCZ7458145.1 trypsin-like peptidase domain-containing protein [Streptomyces sp. WMMC940]